MTDPLEDPEEAFLAAREHEAQGRLDEALAALLALRRRLGATTAALEMQLASVQMRRGNAPEALEALHTAVALKPDLADAQKNIAALLASLGRTEEAREALRRAVAAAPHDATLWVRLASAEAHLGDAAASLRSLARAVEAMPLSASAWREIGQGYAEHWHYAEADRALALASALDPGAPPTESLAAFVKQELGDTEGALQALARAAARDPDNLGVVLAQRLMLPQVYEDAGDVARWRARYTAGLEQVAGEARAFLPRAREVLDLNRQNFLLAYQGEDDTRLQEGYSTLLGRFIEAAHPELRTRLPARFDGGRRLRVGFVGGIFRDCTAGRYFERWITDLDPRRFERFVYHTASVADAFTRRIAGASEHFATRRAGARDTAAKIAADDLDILVHPEVGMSSISYLLAAMRLAPVQAAGWGHPVTTGSDAIDCFFTCGAMEPEGAEAHYVERLMRLPGLGVGYAMPAPPPPGTRAEVGLPEGRRLYLCAQSLFKVHPEMDAILADIVSRDPAGVLVFFQAPARRVTEALAARMQRALAGRGVSPRGQLKFLPRMESAHFRRVLALADVVLDTPRWSGGNTSIDAFAAGVPVVTLPGRFMRGRQTAGMLGLMGLEDLVARDPEDYARIALEVARERAGDLRREIAARREVLFDRPEPLAAFADALLRMGSGESAA
ncbi:MAG: tetratricopeptide repeat protein [Usitatibacter sp.]